MTNLDRSAISRALAKAIAYKQCGQDAKANAWACRLVGLLGASDILDTDKTVQAFMLISQES